METWLNTHQMRSTNPPCAAMAAFTRLANCTASSPSYTCTAKTEQAKKKWTEVDRINNTMIWTPNTLSGCDKQFHLSVHRRQVPNAADNGPAAHHPQQIIHHAKLTAVPESIPKSRIILQHANKIISSVGMIKMSTEEEKEWFLL